MAKSQMVLGVLSLNVKGFSIMETLLITIGRAENEQ
jgi:hypothetical protein